MLIFFLRRLGVMLLTALALTFIVFSLTNLQPNLEKLAKSEASVRMADDAVASWLERNGYGGSVFVRYGEWLGVMPGWTLTDEDGTIRGRCIEKGEDAATAARYCGILQGNWGFSTVFKQPVTEVLARCPSRRSLLLYPPTPARWRRVVVVGTWLQCSAQRRVRHPWRTN